MGIVSFFCQNTNPYVNNATAVLRCLIYPLALQERSVIPYIRSSHDYRGQSLFEDGNVFLPLSGILAQCLTIHIETLDKSQVDLLKSLTELFSSRLRFLV